MFKVSVRYLIEKSAFCKKRIMRSRFLVFGIAGMEAFAASMVGFFFPIFFRDQLGLSGAQIGMLYAAGSATAFLIILPIGFINDRIQSRRLVSASLLLMFIAYTLLPSAKTFWQVMPMFVLLTFGGILLVVSMESLLHKARITENKGVYYGGYNALKEVGIGAGMILGGILLSRLSFGSVFQINSILYSFLFLLTFLLPSVQLGEVTMAHYKKDIFHPSVLVFLFILFIFALHFGAELTAYSLFLQENLGLAREHMGLYMACELGAMVVTSVIVGRLIDKKHISVPWLFYCGMLISGLTQIAMTVPDLFSSVVARTIHGVGDGLMIAFLFLGVSQFFEKERIGGNNGIASFTIKLGIICGALFFGPLGEAVGYHMPFIVSGGLEVLGLLIFLMFLRKKFAYAKNG